MTPCNIISTCTETLKTVLLNIACVYINRMVPAAIIAVISPDQFNARVEIEHHRSNIDRGNCKQDQNSYDLIASDKPEKVS